MTPTSNQLLAALGITDEDTFLTVIKDPEHVQIVAMRMLDRLLNEDLNNSDKLHFWQKAGSAAIYYIPVFITNDTESQIPHVIRRHIQIPIEPITEPVHKAMACMWLINHNKRVNLTARQSHESVPDLLGQAITAGLFPPRRKAPANACDLRLDVATPTTAERLKHEQDINLTGDVPLAFELAGREVPKNWEVWREPDGKQCPSRCTVKSMPTLGTCKVLYHSGEYAMVLGENYSRTEVVRVESLESLDMADIEGMVKASTKKPRAAKEPELTEKQVKDLANKFF